METRKDQIRAALLPFVEAYCKAADPIGDSDLDDEQPRHVTVTLGDCRRASRLLGIYPKVIAMTRLIAETHALFLCREALATGIASNSPTLRATLRQLETSDNSAIASAARGMREQ